mmetsp:Transcript_698/g.1326  ORF Transcript_698/g.1326 Transcript_698/m.1326 type:complete len:134 (-) Transcript_698:168-569(-)
MQQDDKDLYLTDNYFQGNSFGSDDAVSEPLLLLLEAKDQEIQALKNEIESVKAELKDYKTKELYLLDLIQKFVNTLKQKKPKTVEPIVTSRESIKGKQEIILPFLSHSTKNWASSLRSSSPSGRGEVDMNLYG